MALHVHQLPRYFAIVFSPLAATALKLGLCEIEMGVVVVATGMTDRDGAIAVRQTLQGEGAVVLASVVKRGNRRGRE